MTAQHNHQHCIEDALRTADDLCTARGVRFTSLRRRILEMVWQGHKAVKAYDLLDQLAEEGGSAKPPTVYRVLEFLIAEGFVHKIKSLNAYVGCPHPGRPHVSQFLICERCAGIEETNSMILDDAIEQAAAKAGFHILGRTIELRGICSDCQAGMPA